MRQSSADRLRSQSERWDKVCRESDLIACEENALQVWLQVSMLGARWIRAGVPAHWPVGDKTAGGINGANNDIAIIWPPHRAPILLTIFVTRPDRSNDSLPKVIADATKIVAAADA